MTYAAKGDKVFDWQSPVDPDCTPPSVKRSDHRLKRFQSTFDQRAWDFSEEVRYRHLHDLMSGSRTCLGGFDCHRYVPLEDLIRILMAGKEEMIRQLQEKLRKCCQEGDDPEKAALRKQIEELTKEVNKSRDMLRQAIHKLQNIDEIVNENKKLQCRLRCSEERVKYLEEKRKNLECELADLRSKSQIQMDLEKAQRLLTSVIQQREEYTEMDETELQCLSYERDNLQEKVKQLEKELEESRKKEMEIETLKKQSYSDSLDKEEMSRENECYRKKLASMKCLERQIQELKKQGRALADKYRREAQKANEQMNKMCQAAKELQILRDERDSLRKRVDELATYECQYNKLQRKLQRVDAVIAENENLNAKLCALQNLEEENEYLKCKLEDIQELEMNAAEDKERIMQLQCAVADQEEEMKDLLCQIERLTSGRDEEELERLKCELYEKNSKLKLCEEQLAEIPMLEAEIDELRMKLQCCCREFPEKKKGEGSCQRVEVRLPSASTGLHANYRTPGEKATSVIAIRREERVECKDMRMSCQQILLGESSKAYKVTSECLEKKDGMSCEEVQCLLQSSKGIISCVLEDMIEHQKDMEELEMCNKAMKEEIEILKQKIASPDRDFLLQEIKELKKALEEKEDEICRLQQCLEISAEEKEDVDMLKELNRQMKAELEAACKGLKQVVELEKMLEAERKARHEAECRFQTDVDKRPKTSPAYSQSQPPSLSVHATETRVPTKTEKETQSKDETPSQAETGTRGRVETATPAKVKIEGRSRVEIEIPSQAEFGIREEIDVESLRKLEKGIQSKVEVKTPSQVDIGTSGRMETATSSKVQMGGRGRVEIKTPSQAEFDIREEIDVESLRKLEKGIQSKVEVKTPSQVDIGTSGRMETATSSKVQMGGRGRVEIKTPSQVEMGIRNEYEAEPSRRAEKDSHVDTGMNRDCRQWEDCCKAFQKEVNDLKLQIQALNKLTEELKKENELLREIQKPCPDFSKQLDEKCALENLLYLLQAELDTFKGQKLSDECEALRTELKRVMEQNCQLKALVDCYRQRLELEKQSNELKQIRLSEKESGKGADQKSPSSEMEKGRRMGEEGTERQAKDFKESGKQGPRVTPSGRIIPTPSEIEEKKKRPQITPSGRVIPSPSEIEEQKRGPQMTPSGRLIPSSSEAEEKKKGPQMTPSGRLIPSSSEAEEKKKGPQITPSGRVLPSPSEVEENKKKPQMTPSGRLIPSPSEVEEKKKGPQMTPSGRLIPSPSEVEEKKKGPQITPSGRVLPSPSEVEEKKKKPQMTPSGRLIPSPSEVEEKKKGPQMTPSDRVVPSPSEIDEKKKKPLQMTPSGRLITSPSEVEEKKMAPQMTPSGKIIPTPLAVVKAEPPGSAGVGRTVTAGEPGVVDRDKDFAPGGPRPAKQGKEGYAPGEARSADQEKAGLAPSGLGQPTSAPSGPAAKPKTFADIGSEFDSCEDELKAMRNYISNMEKENENLKTSLKNAETRLSLVGKPASEKEQELLKELEKLKKEKESMAQMMSPAAEEALRKQMVAAGTLAVGEDEKQDCMKELEALRKQKEALEKQLAEAKTKPGMVDAEMKTAEEEKRNFLKELEELKKQKEALEKQVKASSERPGMTETGMKTMNEEKENFLKELEALRKEKEELKKQLSATGESQKPGIAEAAMKKAEEEKQDCLKELEALRREKEALTKKLDDALAAKPGVLSVSDKEKDDLLKELELLKKEKNDMGQQLEVAKKAAQQAADAQAPTAPGAAVAPGAPGGPSSNELALQTKLKEMEDDCAEKLKKLMDQHQKELTNREKTYNDNLNAMKAGYETDIRKMADRHKQSIMRLQGLHEDEVKEINTNYETQLDTMQTQSEAAMKDVARGSAAKLRKLSEQHAKDMKEMEGKLKDTMKQKEGEYLKEIGELRRSLTKSMQELEAMKRKEKMRDGAKGDADLMKAQHARELQQVRRASKLKVNAMKEKMEEEKRKSEEEMESLKQKLKDLEKGDGVCECKFAKKKPIRPRDPTCPLDFNEVLEKILEEGMDSLTFNEIALVHRKACCALQGFVMNLKKSPALELEPPVGDFCPHTPLLEADKQQLLSKIVALESEIQQRQRQTQDAIISMEVAIKKERCRLLEVRNLLTNEQERNTKLQSLLSSQTKLHSDLKKERDRLGNEASKHQLMCEEKTKQLNEEIRSKKSLEAEIDKLKIKLRQLCMALDEERGKYDSKQKDQIEIMRLKLEQSIQQEQKLALQLENESKCRMQLQWQLQNLKHSFKQMVNLSAVESGIGVSQNPLEAKCAKEKQNLDQIKEKKNKIKAKSVKKQKK